MASTITRLYSETAKTTLARTESEETSVAEDALQSAPRSAEEQPGIGDLKQTKDDYDDDESAADEIAPKEFICPLTLSVMVDPVLTRHGHTFEREAILRWLARDTGLCPITRKPLRLSDMITNHQLRSRIHRWRQENDLNIRIIVSSDDLHNIFGYIEIPEQVRDMAEHPRDDPARIQEVQHRRRRRGLLGRIFKRGRS